MLRWEPGQGAGSGARQAGAHGFVWLQLRVAPRLLVPSAVVPPHCSSLGADQAADIPLFTLPGCR